MDIKKIRILEKIAIYILLIIIALCVLIPVIWIVLSSLQEGNSLFSSTLIPKKLTIKHYINLFKETDFPLWYWNTFRIAIANMCISVVITTLTAYVFSRYKFKGKKAALITVLVLQMFPSFLAMTAVFILLSKLNLLDTFTGLILVYSAGQVPYNSWLVKGYFDGIPKTLDEAARVDGAGHMTIFLKIILPLAKPIIVLVAITNFMGPWFDFIFPQLVLRSQNKRTLAMGIFDWIQKGANDNFTMFAAGAILVAVPITILYMFLQKHIVKGLSAGAVKG
ncbi:sugar ABC transporter permease [Cetobacterium sp.]|uniref:sugar ABC transporter permease n=1 Tax=Cetobacterium sp. TaxID=2071632 RepID=UPI0025BD4471|nr:sugar ABC transporter permease [Cetobacterium sp.]